jgi:hypothetical protein
MTRIEHLLSIVAEECNETSQRAIKALRFGINEVQERQPLDNAHRLIYEFNDLCAVIDMLYEEGAIPYPYQADAKKLKKEKVNKYLNYAKECGTLQ